MQYGQFRAPCPLCCGTSLETLSSWLFSLQCFFPHQCLLPSHLLNPQTEAKKKERTHMSPVCSPLNYFLWQSISQITFSSLLWSPREGFLPCASNGLLDLQEKQLRRQAHLLPRSDDRKQFGKKINKCLIAWHQQTLPLSLHPKRSISECEMLGNFIKFLPKVKILCSDDSPFSQMHIL